MNTLTRVTTPRNVTVTYRFLGQITRWVHDIAWLPKETLKTDPEKKAEWEKKVKEYAAENGPDTAAAHTAIMTDPHPGTRGNPDEPMHSTVAFEDKDGKRLVYDGKNITGEPMVYSRTHVYENKDLRKTQTYRPETEKEKAERLVRADNIAAKKAAKKAELDKAKAEGKKTPGFDE